MMKSLRKIFFSYNKLVCSLLLGLFLYGCGSGCYFDDPTAIQKGTPSYTMSSSVTLKANGHYSDGSASTPKDSAQCALNPTSDNCKPSTNTSMCQLDPNINNYNQWVNSNVNTSGIATTINFKVSGSVSMCNGMGTKSGLKSNTVSPACAVCYNYYSSPDKSSTVPACCSGCGSNGGGSCRTFCNTNIGGTCPFGQASGSPLPEECNINCIKGSKYYISGANSKLTPVAANILPGDKITIFIDAPNLCGALNVPYIGQNGTGGYPDMNRYVVGYPATSYPKTLACKDTNGCSASSSGSGSSGSKTCSSSPATKAVCPVDTTEKGFDAHYYGGYCWATTGNGLLIYMDNEYGKFTDLEVFSKANSSGGYEYGVTFTPLSGSPAGEPASGTDTYTCQSVTRTFINETAKKIDNVYLVMQDGPTNYGDNWGGYTAFVNHESCTAVNGVPYGNIAGDYGGLQAVVVPQGCDPNVTTPNGNCSGNYPIINLGITNQVKNCQSENSNICSGVDSNKFCPSWSGCVPNDTGAEYFVLSPSSDCQINGQSARCDGNIWLRVKPNEDENAVKNASGTLQVNIAYGTIGHGISNIIAELVEDFTEGILGSLKQQFTDIVCTGDPGSCTCTNGAECQNTYFFYIRVLLLFYIISYGFLFVMGMVKISQYDLVVRVMKIGLVLALTRPDAWNFFYNNFFMLFLDGTGDIIAKSVNQAFTDTSGACASITLGYTGSQTSVQNPFCFIDYGFKMLFANPTTWKKLATYMFINPMTFIMFWYMIYGLVIYIIAVFQAVVTYIISIASVAILLLLAPIFIPFILFEQTKSLFENWVKYLINYTISPILLLIGLNIITMLLYLVLEEILDFTVCWDCAFPIQVPHAFAEFTGSPTSSFCLEWFVPYGGGPSGSGASSETLGTNIGNFIFFIMLLRLMQNYGSYVSNISQMVSNLRLQQFRTTGNLGQGGGIAASISDTMINFGKKAIGQDEASKVKRQSYLKTRIDRRSSGATVTQDAPDDHTNAPPPNPNGGKA